MLHNAKQQQVQTRGMQFDCVTATHHKGVCSQLVCDGLNVQDLSKRQLDNTEVQ